MTTSKPEDDKARFKAALEKKKMNPNSVGKNQVGEGSSKLNASSGNKPKIFRRKSG
jgi:hypothetical protein